jgi:hypothetical protein
MAKPIVVMYIPENGYFASLGRTDDLNGIVQELTRLLNGNFGQPVETQGRITYPDYWKDYYWLVFPRRDIDEPQLDVFYEKDFTPIKFEELKKFIEDALAERNQKSPV